jgi:WD40 repeat protein
MLAGGFFDGGLRFYSVDSAKMLACVNLKPEEGGTEIMPDAEEHKPKGPSMAMKGKWQAAKGLAIGQSGASDKLASITQAAMVHKRTKYKTPMTNVRWWPGHKNIVGGCEGSGLVRLWEVPDIGEDDKLPQCVGSVDSGNALNALAFTCEGDQLVVGGKEKAIKVYDLQRGWFPQYVKSVGGSAPIAGKIVGHSLTIAALVAHPTNGDICLSVGTDKTMLLWDLRVGDMPVGSIYDKELTCGCDSVELSNDGNRVLSAVLRGQHQLKTHDLRMPALNSRDQYEPWGDRNTPLAMYKFSGDEHASSASSQMSCLIACVGWDAKSNSSVVTAGQNQNLARAFKMSRTPAEPLKVIGTLEDRESGFMSCAISASGRTVAFGSANGTVHINEVQSM